MKVLCIFVSLVVAIQARYREEVGIPLAARIKAAEDKISEVPEMESRVHGGEVAPAGAHPYLVGLIIEVLIEDQIVEGICGSSLVSTTRLVTAAHCVARATSIEAVLGSQRLYSGGTRVTTSTFVVHPQFNQSSSIDYDIAVVSLPQPVQLSDSIQPISLPSPDAAEVVGEWGVTAGWGQTGDQNDQLTDQLSQVRLQIVSEEQCKRTYKASTAPGNMVCTSGAGPVAPCLGDSGGPLVVDRNGTKLLVGVSSIGPALCESGSPSVFTRVATYLDFIKQHL